MQCEFFIVATPIGNIKELTPRAIEILSQVDFIASEDTRTTSSLLTNFNIFKPYINSTSTLSNICF